MLVEHIHDWKRYNFGPVWAGVMGWLEQEAPTLADGSYTQHGCTINVVSQKTRLVQDVFFETHNTMIDIQMVLVGKEFLYNAPAHGLTVKSPYYATKDLTFFVEKPLQNQITLESGLFAAIFPWDAHLPAISRTSEPTDSRRLVGKIPLSALHNIG